MRWFRILCMPVLLSLSAGCAWVELVPEAADVVVLGSATEAQTCKRLGQTTVSLRDKVAGVQRDPERVQEELRTLARNSAIKDLKGNAILPVSEIEAGRQTFAVFRCVP